MKPTLLFLFGLLAGAPAAAQTNAVEYEISFPNAEQHEANVVATFRGAGSGELIARMARSSPGRYASTSFAKNVYNVSATDGSGKALEVTRPDIHTWAVRGHNGTVKLSYTVWADRIDGTFASFDRTHAHFNMPATFMYAGALASRPVRLKINPRAGWRIATQLVPTADSTVFTAPNLQYFMDSPTEVGPLMIRTWTTSTGGKSSTYRLAVHHEGTEAQVDSFATMVKRIVGEEEAMMREVPGYDFGTYTFIADYLPWARGDAMEHRNSTVMTSRRSLDSAGRIAVLGTVSHEFFHAWNMERLRSRAIEPFDFDRENMSGELWFGEGFTNYFDEVVSRRAGFMTDEEYASTIGGSINGVVNGPGRKQASAVEMSMLAPFFDGASWLDAPVAGNRFISYYTWGSVIALGLDLTLRQRYNTSLEEYMRTLWRDFGKHQSAALAPSRPYTRDDLRATLATVTKDPAFANDFFRRYVEGREVQDFAPLLAQAGFKVMTDSVPKPYLGASMDNDSAGVFINWTSANGSMYAAGINNGDIIHSFDGVAVNSIDSLNAVAARKKVGDVVQVDFTTRGGRRTVPVTLISVPTVRVVTYESLGLPVTEAMRTFRQNWLGTRVGQAK